MKTEPESITAGLGLVADISYVHPPLPVGRATAKCNKLTEPSETGNPFELLLGHDRCALGEHATQVEDVQNTADVR
jgi:hypothetical protein